MNNDLATDPPVKNVDIYSHNITSRIMCESKRSMKLLFCGCLSNKSACPQAATAPVNNVDLLPSSAVQSMEPIKMINTHCSDSIDSSITDEQKEHNVIPTTVTLPSSALFLTHEKEINEPTTKLQETRSAKIWRMFRPTKCKSKCQKTSKFFKKHVTNEEKNSGGHAAGCSGDKDGDVELKEAFVFSPLPTQIVPDFTNSNEVWSC